MDRILQQPQTSVAHTVKLVQFMEAVAQTSPCCGLDFVSNSVSEAERWKPLTGGRDIGADKIKLNSVVLVSGPHISA